MDAAKHDRPLMFAQREEEHLRSMLWRQPPWITDRPPPGHGWYLVTVSIDVQDDGNRTYSVRLELYDGERWVTAGGYVRVECWYWMPTPWDGVVREVSVLRVSST